MLIRGYQKENERCVNEGRELKKRVEQLSGQVYEGSQKVTDAQMKLAYQTGGFLLVDNDPSLHAMNRNERNTILSTNELKTAQDKIVFLQTEMQKLQS
jgi:Leu/Phe-tRNA-protein transferase